MLNSPFQLGTFRCLLAMLLAGFSSAAVAEVPSSSDILLRNIYVPAGESASWPTDGTAYLPIESERLESLLKTAGTNSTVNDKPRVTQTVLYGSVDSQGIALGIGAMEVRQALSSQWLSLPPGSIRLSHPTWRGKLGSSQRESPQIGYWGPQRGLAIRVAANDWLDFAWRTNSNSNLLATREYSLPLPPSIATTLLLDLPKGDVPEPFAESTALISRVDPLEPYDASFESLGLSVPNLSPDRTRWLLRGAPASPMKWRVQRADSDKSNAGTKPSFSEKLVYRVSESGIELEQQITLSDDGDIPPTLALKSPSALVVRSITWDGKAIPRQLRSDNAGYDLTLPASDMDTPTNHRLVIRAWHPLSKTAKSLPQLRSSDLYWVSGSVQIQVGSTLKVVDLRLRNVAQMVSAPDEMPNALSFQKLTPQGSIDLAVEHRTATNVVRVGRIVQLSTTDTKATVFSQFAGSKPIRVLSARMVDGWTPRSVTAEAPYQIDDWYVSNDEDIRRLVVRASIKQANDGDNLVPLHLKVAGDRRVESARSISASNAWRPLDDYDLLQWENAIVKDNLLTFEVEDGTQLAWTPEPTPLAEDVVMLQLGTLLPATVATAVYDRAELAGSSQLALKPAAPQLDVEITSTLVDQSDRWKMQHRIECTPLQGSIDRLQLVSANPFRRTLRWKLLDTTSWTELDALGGELPRDSNRSTVAEWNLKLPRRQTKPFVVLIDAGTARSDSINCSHMRVLNAENLQEYFEVRSPNPRQIQVDANGWQLVQATREGSLPLHSLWLAGASRQSLGLQVSRHSAGRFLPMARISGATLKSIYAPASPSQHRFECVVDNRAESNIFCTLPESAEDIQWKSTSNNTATAPSVASESNLFTIPLSPSEQTTQIEIQFTLGNNVLGSGAQAVAPWPQLSVPFADGTWTVRYPGDYRALLAKANKPAVSWRDRLFGMLSAIRDAGSLPTKTDSFSTIQLPFNAAEPLDAPIRFRHAPTLLMQRCSVFFLSMLLGYWIWIKPEWLVAALAIAGIASLLLPVSTYAWATASWGGLLLAVAIRCLEQASRAVRQPSGSKSPVPSAAPTAGVVLLATLLTSLPAVANGPQEPRVESILIPVDSHGEITGSERYITPTLLDELIIREQQAGMDGAWVISSPRYSGTLPNNATLSKPTSEWEMAFDLHVNRRDVVIQLPLNKSDADWSTEVLLDGIPARIEWNANGSVATFRVQRAGQYRARLTFQPTMRTANERMGLLLRVPPMPAGELRLDLPAGLKQLQVDGQDISIDSNGDDGPRVLLGMQDELSINWLPADPTDKSTDWTALQWEWLDVSDGQVTLDGAYRIAGTASEPPAPQLVIGDQPVLALGSEPGDNGLRSNAWRLSEPLRLESAGEGEYIARFQLVLDRQRAFGRLRMPKLSLTGVSAGERRIAVTYGDDLAVSLGDTAAVESDLLNSGFDAYWPDRAAPRQMVTADAGGRAPVATVRPAPAELPPDEVLDIACLDDRIEVAYRGDFQASGRPTFYQQVEVSPELMVSEVQVTMRGELQPIEFSRPDPSRLIVLFATPATASYELIVTGSMPLDDKLAGRQIIRIEVPRITAGGKSKLSQQVTLYAADHLNAEVVEAEVVPQLVESPVEAPANPRTYGISTFLAAADRSAPLVIQVTRNRPRFDADMLTTMVRQDGTWIAEVGIVLDINEGTLPELVLDWPATLVGEVDIDLPAVATIESTTDPKMQLLRLRFSRAIEAGNRARMTLRSAVQTESPLVMECPVVGIQTTNSLSRYFGLPVASEGKWVWTGATPTVAPASIEGSLAAWPAATLLKAEDGTVPDVRWVAKTVDEPAYRLPLANVEVQLSHNAAKVVRTEIVWPAFNVPACEIEEPTGQQILQVLVDGQSAVTSLTPSGRTKLLIPDAALPHLVEVVTRLTEANSSAPLATPRLLVDNTECVTEHRVWTFREPQGQARLTSTTAEQLPAVEVAALRLNQLLTAFTATRRPTAPVASAWTSTWLDELTTAEVALRVALEAMPAKTPDIVDLTQATDEYNDLLARATAEIIRTRATHPQPAETDDTLPNSDTLATDTQIFVQSSDGQMQWSSVPVQSSNTAVRWTLALAFAALATAHIATRDRQRSFEWSYDLVFPVVVVVGLLWWLWLWPRFAGLLLALAAIAAWLRWNQIRNDGK